MQPALAGGTHARTRRSTAREICSATSSSGGRWKCVFSGSRRTRARGSTRRCRRARRSPARASTGTPGRGARTWCRSAGGRRAARRRRQTPRTGTAISWAPAGCRRTRGAQPRAPERRVQSALVSPGPARTTRSGTGRHAAPTACPPRRRGRRTPAFVFSSIGACPRPAPRRLIPRRMHPRDGVAPASMRERRVEARCRKIVRGLLMTNDGS